MNLENMQMAVSEAKTTLSNADAIAQRIAILLRGRLRQVDSSWLLDDLKRELTRWNSHTHEWKD